MRPLFLASALALALAAPLAQASDHVDGPKVVANPHADLTDLYAFPRNDGKSLVVVLNTHPFRARWDSLDPQTPGFMTAGLASNVSLKITISALERRVDRPVLEPAGEPYALTCGFGQASTLTCSDNTSQRRAFSVPFNESQEFAGARVWFGKSADPFFFDAQWSLCVSRFSDNRAFDASKSGETDNTLDLMNVFSLVFEIEAEQLLGGTAGLVGIVGESFVDDPGGQGKPFDRVGRPEVTNLLLVTQQKPVTDRDDLRADFNGERPFEAPDAKYRDWIERTVRRHDDLWDPADWNNDEAIKTFSAMMASDFLTVDLERLDNCPVGSFLDIERHMIFGTPGMHATCGGRRFEEDIMDRLYALLFAGDIRAQTPNDGVHFPALAYKPAFPYVPDPFFLSVGFLAQRQVKRARPDVPPSLCGG